MNATDSYMRASEDALEAFVRAILVRMGVSDAHAVDVADVLVEADVRGVESHGVARLNAYYVSRIRAGILNARATYRIAREGATTLLLDAGNGLGHPAGIVAMRAVIEKARASGAAFGVVTNSNHYGIAAYYAMMALEHDMIGMSATNSVRYAVPTFGRDLMLGTNPLAFAIPAGEEPPFVLDFATTTVPRGRLEVFKRKGLPLEPGWAVDANGRETLDPQTALQGALLPLGGLGTEHGGHKGYGLGLLVDILCGVLGGGAFGPYLGIPSADDRRGAVSHWFGAFRVDAFRDVAAFKRDMDEQLRAFKNSAKAPGCDRIYVAGEIEHERALHNRTHGVPIHASVWNDLQRLAGDLDVPFDL